MEKYLGFNFKDYESLTKEEDKQLKNLIAIYRKTFSGGINIPSWTLVTGKMEMIEMEFTHELFNIVDKGTGSEIVEKRKKNRYLGKENIGLLVYNDIRNKNYK